MAEWVYRATGAKASREYTRAMALDDGFLCRSLHTRAGQRSSYATTVAVGDVVHLYFRAEERADVLGSFEVLGVPDGVSGFSSIEGTALVRVDDVGVTQRLAALGYEVDPVLGAFTGWLVKARVDVRAPPYAPEMFPGQGALRPWGERVA